MKYSGKNPAGTKGEHGSATEVVWDGGKGRQPYQNQGPEEQGPATGDGGFVAGDRGDLSGRNLEQLREVKKIP